MYKQYMSRSALRRTDGWGQRSQAEIKDKLAAILCMKFHSLRSLEVNLVKEQILQHVSAQEACGMQECSSLKRGHLHTGLKSTELGPHPDSFIRCVQNNQGLLAGELPSSGAARP